MQHEEGTSSGHIPTQVQGYTAEAGPWGWAPMSEVAWPLPVTTVLGGGDWEGPAGTGNGQWAWVAAGHCPQLGPSSAMG